jgi:prophage DNA circulation protein
VKLNAFTIQNQAAALKDYTNVEQIVSIKDTLNTSFYNLPQDIIPDAYDTVLNARSETRKVLDDKTLTLPKIINVQVNQQPVSAIAYKYYGDLSRVDQIVALNNIKNPSSVSGNLKILSF